MPSDDSPKSIPVRLDANNGQFVFINPCPWCGTKHHHGAGEEPYTKERLNGMLGHRVAHCTSNSPERGYILVWPTGPFWLTCRKCGREFLDTWDCPHVYEMGAEDWGEGTCVCNDCQHVA